MERGEGGGGESRRAAQRLSVLRIELQGINLPIRQRFEKGSGDLVKVSG
jgi:hypothetical protein